MRPVTADESGTVRWTGRVMTAIELERLGGTVAEMVVPPNTVITPSARDWLRDRGVRLNWVQVAASAKPHAAWCVAQERTAAVIEAAVDSLRRERLDFGAWPARGDEPFLNWVRRLAEEVASGRPGAVVFCSDPAVTCCAANKLAGIRAAAVGSAAETQRALQSMGANWLVVEMAGRTFFEVRQILRTIAAGSSRPCPPEVAQALAELEKRG